MHNTEDLYLCEYKGEVAVLDTKNLHPLRIRNLLKMRRIKHVQVIVATTEEGVGAGL